MPAVGYRLGALCSLAQPSQCYFLPSSCFTASVSGCCFDLRIEWGKVLIPLAPPMHTKQMQPRRKQFLARIKEKLKTTKKKTKSLVSSMLIDSNIEKNKFPSNDANNLLFKNSKCMMQL